MVNLRFGAIIQARLSSQRLPRKVLLPLPYDGGPSVIEHIINRAKMVAPTLEVVIATSENSDDDDLASLAQKLNVRCFRGSKNNVLSRFYFAAREAKLDVMCRLTADNPTIDPRLLSETFAAHLNEGSDYTATRLFPLGNNAEIISFPALERAFQDATTDYEKEHVTPHLYDNPGKFKVSIREAPSHLQMADARVTLDTEQDYALLCLLFEKLYPTLPHFGIPEIISLFEKQPWIKMINRFIVHKTRYPSEAAELDAAADLIGRQDMRFAETKLRKILEELKGHL